MTASWKTLCVALLVAAGCGPSQSAPDAGPRRTEIHDATTSMLQAFLRVDFAVYNGEPEALEIERMRVVMVDCAPPCVQVVDSAYPPLGGDPVFCTEPLLVPPGASVPLWMTWELRAFGEDPLNYREWSCPGSENPGFYGCTCGETLPPRGTEAVVEVYFTGVAEPLREPVTF